MLSKRGNSSTQERISLIELFIRLFGKECIDCLVTDRDYAKRWQIETCFKAIKTSGFNIEKTHLDQIHRVEKLLLLVMVVFDKLIPDTTDREPVRLIVVVAVVVRLAERQTAAVGVIAEVLCTTPPAPVVAHSVERTIVVAVGARKGIKATAVVASRVVTYSASTYLGTTAPTRLGG